MLTLDQDEHGRMVLLDANGKPIEGCLVNGLAIPLDEASNPCNVACIIQAKPTEAFIAANMQKSRAVERR